MCKLKIGQKAKRDVGMAERRNAAESKEKGGLLVVFFFTHTQLNPQTHSNALELKVLQCALVGAVGNE
ncbi:hypothetical protein Ddc_03809 [Ditylenchus destructor]|nr:hypothetical protein Ddc_03809 [Ditylenchus destructor]